MLTLMKQNHNRINTYERINEQFSESQAARSAKSQLRLLALKGDKSS